MSVISLELENFTMTVLTFVFDHHPLSLLSTRL